MLPFYENLSNFLTECRNNALAELRTDKRYTEVAKSQADLYYKLEALISPEAVPLLEDYTEAAVAVHAMECNTSLLCGLAIQSNIRRHFDESTPEYTALVEEHL